MLKKNIITPKAFNWGGHNEFIIESKKFSISNINSGLQTSSFSLDGNPYELIISDINLNLEDVFDSFSGIPQLSGSEEQNKWLEENQKTKPHIRMYRLSGVKTSIRLYHNYLDKHGLLGKELYIYLIDSESVLFDQNTEARKPLL